MSDSPQPSLDGPAPLRNLDGEEDTNPDEAFEYRNVNRSAPMPITSLSRPAPSKLTPPSSTNPFGLSATPRAGFPAHPEGVDSSRPKGKTSDRDMQAEVICQVCQSGDLDALRHALPTGSEATTWANTPSSKSGLLPIHYAALRGSIAHCSYLLNEVGALPTADDLSGETALHKATMRGHQQVVCLLIERGGIELVESADNDGWTALHNAASKGFLDIVRLLIDVGAQVDAQSKIGITALACAASRGHALVVRYLLREGKANPFIRNAHGETAYDAAVASFECHVADLLVAAEMSAAGSPYNVLAVHLNAAIILHENQRISPSRDLNGAETVYSSSSLLATDKRTPFSMPPGPFNDELDHLQLFRSDIQLPTIDSPFVLPLPASARWTLAPNGNERPLSRPASPQPGLQPERSHFWLSEWALDLKAPQCDLQEGWTYASSFDAPAEAWSADSSVKSAKRAVRYRRWVRVVRRRLDRPSLPLLGDATTATKDIENSNTQDTDYLVQAKGKVSRWIHRAEGQPSGSSSRSLAQSRRTAIGLESAIATLREGLAEETDNARITDAQRLIEACERRLHDLTAEHGGAWSTPPRPTRSTSLGSMVAGHKYVDTDNVSASNLMSAHEFRVPMHETPASPGVAPDLPPPSAMAIWQPDEEANVCFRCSKRFSLFLRKHHCRLCGRVVCATCSPHIDAIDASRLVPDPHQPSPFLLGPGSASSRHRTCHACHGELTTAVQRPLPARASAPPSPLNSVASDISELTECVVCGESLAPMGAKSEQERHVQACLERGNGSVSNANRYIEFRLPATSPLLHTECDVCMEDLVAGQAIARLSCLCSFREQVLALAMQLLVFTDAVCARGWLSRGRGCPVHSLREGLL